MKLINAMDLVRLSQHLAQFEMLVAQLGQKPTPPKRSKPKPAQRATKRKTKAKRKR